jgi:hypothetical protein
MADTRKSDRWVTPGVIIAAILVAGLLLAVIAGGVTFLASKGIDPDPMLDLVAKVGTLITSTGALVLQLTGRATAAKTERNTGVLAGVVADVAAAPAPPPPRQAPAYVIDLDDDPPTEQRVTVPPLPEYPRHRRSAGQ